MVTMTVTRRGRRLLRLGLGLIVLGAAAAAGWMWLRDSSLVEVRDVQITGVTASDGELVKSALDEDCAVVAVEADDAEAANDADDANDTDGD